MCQNIMQCWMQNLFQSLVFKNEKTWIGIIGKWNFRYCILYKFINTNLFCRNPNVFDKKKIEDPTQLIATFRVTELVGIVSLLYGMLLHCNAPERGSGVVPPELPQHTLAVTTIGIRMLNFMATLDLNMLQVGSGDVLLQFTKFCPL